MVQARKSARTEIFVQAYPNPCEYAVILITFLERGIVMASKKGLKNKGITPQKANRWVGHPVCVVLHDGSYYVGMVTGIDNDGLILSGARGDGKLSPSISSKDKVRVSGFLQSMFGGGGAVKPPAAQAAGGFNPFSAGPVGGGPLGAGLGGGQANSGLGGGDIFGMVKQYWPHVRMGFQMVKTIMPMMRLFKI
jgi:hypothetical protein